MKTYPKVNFVAPALKVNDPGEMKVDRGVIDWQGTTMGSLHMTPVQDIWMFQDKVVIDYGEEAEPKEVLFQDMSRGRFFTLDRAEALVPELRAEVGLPPPSPGYDTKHFEKLAREVVPQAPRALKTATSTMWTGAAVMAVSVIVAVWTAGQTETGCNAGLPVAAFFLGAGALFRGIDGRRQAKRMAAGEWRPPRGQHGWQTITVLVVLGVIVIAALALVVVAANSQ